MNHGRFEAYEFVRRELSDAAEDHILRGRLKM